MNDDVGEAKVVGGTKIDSYESHCVLPPRAMILCNAGFNAQDGIKVLDRSEPILA